MAESDSESFLEHTGRKLRVPEPNSCGCRFSVWRAMIMLVPNIIHIGFFVLESILFSNPDVSGALFGITKPELVSAVKLWATNQGFYNLFLAIAGFVGIFLLLSGRIKMGKSLLSCVFSIYIGAGVVLFITSGSSLLAGAAVQAGPALISLVFVHF